MPDLAHVDINLACNVAWQHKGLDAATIDIAQSSLNDDVDVTVDYSVTTDKFFNSVCPYELRGDHSYGTGPGSLHCHL